MNSIAAHPADVYLNVPTFRPDRELLDIPVRCGRVNPRGGLQRVRPGGADFLAVRRASLDVPID